MEICEILSEGAGPSAAQAQSVLDPLFDLADLDEDTTVIDIFSPAADEPTDVPVELPRELTAMLTAGPRILFHDHFSLVCRFHDDGAGTRVLISY